MKIGLSTYSLGRAFMSGEMTPVEAIAWIAENGGEHVEISPFGFDLSNNEKLVDSMREMADKSRIDISNYPISADFLKENDKEFAAEIKRVMHHVDIANRLGVKLMRHDVVGFVKENTVASFEKNLPILVKAIREIADYASQYGITTSVENHGTYINGSERVLRLIHEVDRKNFKMTLDVGNFWCVDEDPVIGVKRCIKVASMVHFKDFYFRKPKFFCKNGDSFKLQNGWFRTLNGNLIRGAIVGDGDIDMTEIMSVIKSSGYDGYISVEFEGMEECKAGSQRGMQYSKVLAENVE